ncbi:bacteriocin immunity protein [Pseudomonas vranovensis]|uniref:bacteriocin immunity protein n=1 Tax=Pseudomonas vranovensis TaxID=321661 RepID=UPI003D998E4A
MILKATLSEYTELEFLELLKEIDQANEDAPDEILDPLLRHFESIIEHPAGTDLLYWPQTPEQGEPEQIIQIIKQWRAANGKPGFRPG